MKASAAVHSPSLWAGALLHGTLSAGILAFAVVFGPALAWLAGTELTAVLVASSATLLRALVGGVNARALWNLQARAGLCLRTVVAAALLGYAVPMGALSVLGLDSQAALGTGPSLAAIPLLVDLILTLGAVLAGALISQAPRGRRRRKSLLLTRLHRHRLGPGIRIPRPRF